MSFLLISVFLFAGLGLLTAGGEVLVRGASSLGLRLGLSPLVIGLTVVAFGTSAPELIVSVLAALRGNAELALANVIGSNICNIGLILSLAALVSPLSVQSRTLKIDIPLLLIVTVTFCLLLWDSRIGPVESSILLCALLIYSTLSYVLARDEDVANGDLKDNSAALSSLTSVILVVVGLGLLAFGADVFIQGAIGLAKRGGLSDAVIGVTIVAVGTSLPELFASLVAAYRKQSDIAIGNVVGSNVFNILGVAGTAGFFQELLLESLSLVDLLVMLLLTALLIPLCRSSMRISRLEASFLLAMYLAYISYRAIPELAKL